MPESFDKDAWVSSPTSASKTSAPLFHQLTRSDLSTAMSRLKERLGRTGHDSGGAHDAARALRRKHKKLVNRFVTTIASLEPPGQPERNLIADTIYPRRAKIWRVRRRPQTKIVVKELSFIDNPNGAFETLKTLVRAECINRNSKLDFLMERCHDIAPFLVLGLMWRGMYDVFDGGKISPPVAKVMKLVQLEDFLEMSVRNLSEKGDIWSFPLREMKPHPQGQIESIGGRTRDKAATDLVESIDRWLDVATEEMEQQLSLTEHGRRSFQELVCEILENAERHGSDEGFIGGWACAGFMARRRRASDQTKFDHVCHLAFVNTGRTIAEGLQAVSDTGSKTAIDLYLQAQTRWVGGSESRRNLLRTVMAIQPGITRKQHENTSSGGVGFRRIIDALHALTGPVGYAQPEITIISGDSCVRIAAPYARIDTAKEGLPGLFFNPENTIYGAPDSAHAMELDHQFPGTIIAARFIVSPEGSDVDG